MKKNVCMIVQEKSVKGGIASVVNGYSGSVLEERFNMHYVESYRDGTKMAKLLKALSGYMKFFKVIISNKITIVHIHSSFGPSFYRKIPYILAAKLFNIRIVNHIHGAEFERFYTGANKAKQYLVKNIYSKCDFLIALSEEWVDNLSQIVPKYRIKVVYNYSTLHPEALSDRQNRKSGKKVLFLGEIGKRKGCFDIPAIIESIAEECDGFEVVMGGTGMVEEITDILKSKGIEKYASFPGWVRDRKKHELLMESDVFLLPSYDEGMPMAILDAMGYALPIVSTNVGAIPKIVRDGENGALCDPGDVARISQSIVAMLENEEMLKKFGRTSYRIVEEAYALECHIDRVTEIYNELI